MIVINRHNYETYFLLWVDGELSSEEKVAVERFVAENPDLAEELALLQSAQLHPDETLVFKGKEILYKREGQDISLNNYEEWFLLYTDNELSEEQKIQVELFVLQHPDLQSGNVLILEGDNATSTEAAGEFVSSEEHLSQFFSRIGYTPSRPGETPPSFEVLLQTERLQGSTRSFRIVSYRATPQ